MSEMIEIVAKAIEAEKQRGGMAGSWTNADENRRLAEAAIRAMREPTPEMVGAAVNHQLAQTLGLTQSREVWYAMIDAALSSPPSKS
jgi:hypothetical protein